MKQSLQLRISQQLAMTPQLQQAIRLLQLSTLELQQEIQLALETNPLLEQEESSSEQENLDNLGNDTDSSEIDTKDALENADMPDELPLDADWDEIYTAGTPSGTSNDYSFDELPVYQGETTQTLQDYLIWQADLTPFTDTDRAIATSIIDSIDDSGYLTSSISEIHEGIDDPDITLEEVVAVLKRIQHFDPLGVAAQDLKECLLIQLSLYPKETIGLQEARLIISNHIDLLANRDFRQLSKLTRLKEDALKTAIDLILTLNPKPGQSINTGESEYVIPDVLVKKVGGHWQVELNTDSIPKLSINNHYASMANDSASESDTQYIRSHLQDAKWLIKSLESRHETLLKVATCIVEQQQEFFELGEEYMKPMILADIAYQVDMHESTISRVTTQKFLHSPRGIFELKYFFSSHVSTDTGGEASSTAIRALVKKLVAAENPAKPLSDSKLTSMLAEQGIQVARRTVAKYRESLSIPPSNQRKQLV
ncbi:RNA polymerase factor sigma-54 [Providencia sp. PROV188]|uniref:RNA polymerase factor sigma-54 n=1 Tax=Providencia TaxID=586 RepID=UPI0003E1FAB9|nr:MULTISPECIES: RNA polymerase factor sigma-54 [Providencia]ETS98387.1 RNA polymerase sigma-54 factor [Providencia alcalifaciens PAL-3]EUC97999.1 RNA polymerase sigma-54 factor [Providencia alcalifaciens PAL-1]MBG5883248.1 RNA polymerase factor sigma-54 [Providencia alcalifaciens]MBS0923083.1 RNA polymerase factor sigma-54 [Providencia sp. JGM181]MBS0934356.1 RNA polymerase factor sigma-54 [Providencia sp. JGM172]